MAVIVSVLLLLSINAVFVLVCLGLVRLLSKYKHTAYAVMKRNFIGYFSNPTGYLFILLFVGLCSFWAFFPHDFFNDNLATLHQLNERFPWIMLVFIPTITMGIWSEERRQGTDELLLTVPADDWDVVLGKYLSAAAIFSVSLLVSQIANFMVLTSLAMGDIDIGLFVTTYVGYWFIGLAMISVGMVGSFLTKNQTIGFILGLLLNLPLVLTAYADAIIASDTAQRISKLSYSGQFVDFGRGVISLRAVIFFLMVTVIGLYLSVVLVGRRHWLGGKDGDSMLGHYVARTVALVVLAFSLTFFFMNHDRVRRDFSSEQIASLSPDTLQLIKDLDTDQTILIEAFISAKIPEDYVQTKIDLISKLQELRARAGNKIELRIFDNLAPFSDEAVRAEEQYGIQPSTVFTRERGVISQEEIFLGAAFTRGLEKVVVPFFDQGIPVEYELIRSISTVSEPKRKRLGIVNTDAQLFGGFDMQRMSQIPRQLIVEELEKQYEVVQIDLSSPIQEEVDVLLAVQPSSLNPAQMDNLVAAVRSGVPTAIFEDPMPVMMTAPGTSQPKPPRGGMMGMGGQPPEPKGDINALWSLLGIKMTGDDQMGQFNADVVWQEYNPYKKARGFRQITDEWVFVSPDAPGAEEPISPKSDITSGLRQILFLYPGGIKDQHSDKVVFTPLVSTGRDVGTINWQEFQMRPDPLAIEFRRQANRSPSEFVLAAQIQSKDKREPSKDGGENAKASDEKPSQEGDAKDEKDESSAASADESSSTDESSTDDANSDSKAEGPINVVYVGDIDLIHSEFLRVRAQPNMSDIDWQFDNVTFVLNVIDQLAGDDRFLDIRKRQTRHSTLRLVEAKAAEKRAAAEREIDEFSAEFDDAEKAAKDAQEQALADLQKRVDDLQAKAQSGGGDLTGREAQRALQAALQQVALKEAVERRRFETKVERRKRERDRKLRAIERELDTEIQHTQNWYKGIALFVPMLPPVFIGLVVFILRRQRESEGMTSDRRR